MVAWRHPGTPPKTVCWWDQKRRQAKPADEHWEDGTEFLSSPLAWFWARALNLAGILNAKTTAALARLHSLPPSELAALVLVTSETTTDGNRKTTMIIWEKTLVASLEQLTLACQAWQAAKFLCHFVVCSLVDGLSVEQMHRLDVPPVQHWRPGQSFTLTLVTCVHCPDNNKRWPKNTCQQWHVSTMVHHDNDNDVDINSHLPTTRQRRQRRHPTTKLQMNQLETFLLFKTI